MITLGIETSCDETALSLIETRERDGYFECKVIASLIHSQAELHSSFGGVYPALAKREHGRNLLPLLRKLLEQNKEVYGDKPVHISDSDFDNRMNQVKEKYANRNADLFASFTDTDFLKIVPNIDKIAITEGPGLEPALWVGISFGEILSIIWSDPRNLTSRKIPVIPVNHMEGHIVGSLLSSDVEMGEWQRLKQIHFPALALLISGGHTELVKIENNSNNKDPLNLNYSIIGQTKDDAVGEAFDKVARLLGLLYPGGPHVSKLAKEAEEHSLVSPIKLPRPMINSGDLNFSFSGLKTAVLYAVRDEEKKNGSLSDDWKRALAREFEQSVMETLDTKLRQAIEEVDAKTIIIGGGVIANITLRQAFEALAQEYNVPLYLPSSHISGDNALMIALAGALDNDKHDRMLKADGTKRLNAELPLDRLFR
jgi:N6-L-threonylcarbamoyladenine synthase